MSQDKSFIRKSRLHGPISRVGWSLWGSLKAGPTVLVRLTESQIWHQLAISKPEGGFRKGTMASAYLDARHFSLSLYTTDAFQVATQ